MKLAITATFLMVLGCAAGSNVDIEPLPVATLQGADATQDANVAFEHGDIRFVGIQTLGLMVPGVPAKLWPAFQKAYGIRVIDAEGDHLESAESITVRSLSVSYAVRFNNRMLTLLTAQAESLWLGMLRKAQ
jgi:hypothetical protein